MSASVFCTPKLTLRKGARQVMDKLRPYIEQSLALAAARRADAREEAAALQALAERQHLGRRAKRDAGSMQAAAPVQEGGAGKAGSPACCHCPRDMFCHCDAWKLRFHLCGHPWSHVQLL